MWWSYFFLDLEHILEVGTITQGRGRTTMYLMFRKKEKYVVILPRP
jgi:hypothetical protein